MDEWQSTNAPTISKSWTVGSGPGISITYVSGIVLLQFEGRTGTAYTVQYTDSLNPANWQLLQEIPALAMDALQIVNDNSPAPFARFYRIQVH